MAVTRSFWFLFILILCLLQCELFPSRNDVLFNKVINITKELSQPVLNREEVQRAVLKSLHASGLLNALPEIASTSPTGMEITKRRKEALDSANDIKNYLREALVARQSLLQLMNRELSNAQIALALKARSQPANVEEDSQIWLLEWWNSDKYDGEVARSMKGLQRMFNSAAMEFQKKLAEGPDVFERFRRSLIHIHSLLSTQRQEMSHGIGWLQWLLSEKFWDSRRIGYALSSRRRLEFLEAPFDFDFNVRAGAARLGLIIASENPGLSTVTTVREKWETIRNLRKEVKAQSEEVSEALEFVMGHVARS